MPVKCTVCGIAMLGYPDADVTCPECEDANFAGDPLRHPPAAPAAPTALVGAGSVAPGTEPCGRPAGAHLCAGAMDVVGEHGIEERSGE